MNNISWFLYVVDVLGSLSKILSVLTIGLFTVYIIGWFLYALIGDLEFNEGQGSRWKSNLKTVLVVLMIAVPLSIITPNQKTLYLILGSEVGEQVAMSETGKRVQDAINKKLDEYLGET